MRFTHGQQADADDEADGQVVPARLLDRQAGERQQQDGTAHEAGDVEPIRNRVQPIEVYGSISPDVERAREQPYCLDRSSP
jgi:hypothetical protein